MTYARADFGAEGLLVSVQVELEQLGVGSSLCRCVSGDNG